MSEPTAQKTTVLQTTNLTNRLKKKKVKTKTPLKNYQFIWKIKR